MLSLGGNTIDLVRIKANDGNVDNGVPENGVVADFEEKVGALYQFRVREFFALRLKDESAFYLLDFTPPEVAAEAAAERANEAAERAKEAAERAEANAAGTDEAERAKKAAKEAEAKAESAAEAAQRARVATALRAAKEAEAKEVEAKEAEAITR